MGGSRTRGLVEWSFEIEAVDSGLAKEKGLEPIKLEVLARLAPVYQAAGNVYKAIA